ncbi:MAG: DoxX family protein [Spirosomataceae bacterium]
MDKIQKLPKLLNMALWGVQGLLAAGLLWAAGMKLGQSAEKLAQMWPWANQVPEWLVKFTGLTDLAGGIGIIAPTLLHTKPQFTIWASYGIMLLMIGASLFHILRGEALLIGPNIVFFLMAGFVAWGRK